MSQKKRAKWVSYNSEWKKVEAKDKFFSFASQMEDVERQFPTVSHLKGMSKEFHPIDPAFHMVANVLNKVSIENDLTLQGLNENIEKDLEKIKTVSEVWLNVVVFCLFCSFFVCCCWVSHFIVC